FGLPAFAVASFLPTPRLRRGQAEALRRLAARQARRAPAYALRASARSRRSLGEVGRSARAG
ncbi:MAG: hypothetical protein ACRD1X_03780, partial [Vicinamibacteria bacterium]